MQLPSNPVHGQQDPITKKFYNATTGKWVVKLRATAKGKTKGLTHLKKVKDQDIPEYQAYLPINLTVDKLNEVFRQLWPNPNNTSYDINRAIATINYYYYNRYCSGFKNSRILDDGSIYIPDMQFKKWVHSTYYKYYIQVLEQAEILYRLYYMNSEYNADKALYSYSINTELTQSNDILKQWYQIEYSDTMKVKIHKLKMKREKNINQSKTRVLLNEWAKKIVLDIDFKAMYTDLNIIVKKSRKKDPWNNCKIKKQSLIDILTITQNLITAESYYCNLKDESGHRLHTPLTNINDYVIGYVRIKGQKAQTIDLSNSQMYFFSLCLQDFDLVYPFLKAGDNNQLFRGALRLIESKKDNEDMKRFKQLSLTGEIYDTIAKHFNKERSWAKKQLFKVLFSDSAQCINAKDRIKSLFPTLNELSNILNENKLIPLMMQRLESSIMIDIVCSKIIEEGYSYFFTRHDSITCKESDYDSIKKIMLVTFKELNLPQPAFK